MFEIAAFLFWPILGTVLILGIGCVFATPGVIREEKRIARLHREWAEEDRQIERNRRKREDYCQKHGLPVPDWEEEALPTWSECMDVVEEMRRNRRRPFRRFSLRSHGGTVGRHFAGSQ